jgi:hypothetical protein
MFVDVRKGEGKQIVYAVPSQESIQIPSNAGRNGTWAGNGGFRKGVLWRDENE